jgi:hypothetical protein
MKWLFFVANLIAAITLFFLGIVAVAAHRAHASSVYEELKIQHVLAERPDYDVEKRLRTIADGGVYSLWIAEIAAGICLANAVAIGIWFKQMRRDAHPDSNQETTGNLAPRQNRKT